MMLDVAPQPPIAMRGTGSCGQNQPRWSDADISAVAVALFVTWAARTGRILPDAPIADLSPEEIINFWVDDQLEKRYTHASHPRPP